MNTLIRNVLIKNKRTDILIKGNRIAKIASNINEPADNIINGTGKLAMPGLMNAHTHAAMTLLRGYSDDLPVKEWLETKIWPLEATLTEEDVYWGAKLACLEMIRTGTTFFNDMYWHYHGTARAVDEMGLRATISPVFLDFFNPEQARQHRRNNEQWFTEIDQFSDRVQFIFGPHAVYSVSPESLRWIREFANEKKVKIHIHLSETEQEVRDCIKMSGKRPVEYLDELGFLGSDVLAAHAIWLSEHEMNILKDQQVSVIHNPISNMKLSSGIFKYSKIRDKGIRVLLGTDGCASNNNLDMFEEMKIASILDKLISGDPTSMPPSEVLDMATINAAQAFDLNCGEIKEGKLADLILINLKSASMTPLYHAESNLVYSMNGYNVDTTICDGKILMQNGVIPGEPEILEKVSEIAYKLILSKPN